MKYLIPTLMMILCAVHLQGQNNAPANVSDYDKMSLILPPPPNAASLGKYGGINTNLSSGAVNIDIPFLTYTSKNINVPISLSYTSNGIKVDEIASRVGMGWNLNCGGVITRTAYGNIDEFAVGAPLPALVGNENLINWMESVVNPANVYSYSQPDIFNFNFNGYSGKFILDTAYNTIKIQGKPILLTYSALKIESQVGDGNQFKITTPDGIQYFFGSGSTEYSYAYPTGGCPQPYNYYSAGTAFYMSKIVHPNKDTINFVYAPIKYNYKTSTTETIYSTYTGGQQKCDSLSYAPTPSFMNKTCLNWLETRGVLLQEINSTKFGRVALSYITRNDYNDGLVSGLQYYKPGEGTPYKTISFNYQYSYSGSSFTNSYTTDSLSRRPFLKNIIESSADGSLTKKHSFNYNDINSLPPRLSFAQDDYGFFNGKNNSTLIPLPTDPYYKQALPLATADRSVNPNFSSKGLLTSITYPTGGKDSIVYESNQINQIITVPPANATITATAFNQYLSGGSTVNYSNTALISYDQQVTLSASCVSPTVGETNFKTTNVYFTDETANTVVLNQTLQYNQDLNQTFVLKAGHSYKLRVTVTGENVTGNATLTYKAGVPTDQSQNINVAGVRVAKTITTDKVTSTANVKKYNYSFGNYSSTNIVYGNILKARVPCVIDDHFNGAYHSCKPLVYNFYTMYSNSIYNIYTSGPAPVMYTSVIESFGENYENGGIEHQFTNTSDFLAGNFFGDNIINAPVTSLDFRRGKEIYQGVFKKLGGNTLYTKKIFTHYTEDPRVDHEVGGIVVNKNFTITNGSCDPLVLAFQYNQYNLMRYGVFQKWVYADTVKTWNYGAAGQNYTEEKTITEYANPANALPTKITSFTSDGLAKTQTNFYPSDLSLTGDAEIARQQLIAKNMSPALHQKVTKNNTTQQFLLNTEYNVFQNGLVLPKRKIVQIANNPPESRIEFVNYDNKGNILEESQTNGTSITHLWGYNQQYPVAEAKNAKANEIYLANEEEGTDFPAGYIIQDGSRAHSGHYSGRIDNGNSSEVVYHSNTWLQVSNNTPKSYHYSGWVYSNGPSIDIFLFMKRAGEGGYFSYVDAVSTGEIGKWVYLSKDFLVPADVTQLNLRVDNNGSTNGQVQSIWFDDLRIHPSNALMTTYTYDPLVGMTSQTDPKGMTTTYEYDSFQRLLNVKDKDGNIIKHNDYHYQNQ